MSNDKKIPQAALWLIIALMLPLAAYPWLLSSSSEAHKTLLWIYPAYVLLTGLLAYLNYTTRPHVSYILLATLLLSHIAIWCLTAPKP